MPSIDPNTTQTSDLSVYMVGDANNQIPLLLEAADEGYIAGMNATCPDSICFKCRTPLAIVFADPSMTVVGSRFQALDSEKTLIGETCFDRQGRARAGQRNKGIIRHYAEANSGRLLGCRNVRTSW